MRSLDVTRHGHLNHFTGDYDSTIGALRTLLDGDAFWEWEAPLPATRNALVMVGPLCIELFAPLDGGGIVATYLEHRPAGWHSLEWTVPDLAVAADVVAEHDIRITELDENYFFTHPKDLGGLTLEVTFHHFDGDPRDQPGWNTRTGSGDSPLGFAGLPVVVIGSIDPELSAKKSAALVGAPATDRSVELVDHRINFVDAEAPGIQALLLPVMDLDRAADVLSARGGEPPLDDDVLWLEIHGARIGLIRAAG